jgi:predicted nicotinamide N-methyase
MERQKRALLARIQSHVTIVETHTVIAGTTVPWIKVTDPDQLLLQALAKGEDGSFEQDPFWAAAWRAAVGMDHFLGSIADQLKGTRVLELGGGSGRAGISAAMHGAQVWITDAATVAMLVCRYNSLHVAHQVQIRCLDWRNRETGLGRFPIIVGSDIVYDPKLFPILEPCVRRHLDVGGVAYFSEPQRHTGDRFKKWIQSAGWLLNEHLIDLKDGEKEIRIFECRLPNRC